MTYPLVSAYLSLYRVLALIGCSLERYCEDLKEEIEYVVERLPEGGEGMYGFDDGQGDD